MCERRTIAREEDPVCGAILAPDEATRDGLAAWFEDVEYAFCGERCLLEFREDPETFLRSAYVIVT